MVVAPDAAKIAIIQAIETLYSLFNRRPNAFLLQVFFDAKSQEIVDIFSGGPQVDVSTMVSQLKRMAPFLTPSGKKSNSNRLIMLFLSAIFGKIFTHC